MALENPTTGPFGAPGKIWEIWEFIWPKYGRNMGVFGVSQRKNGKYGRYVTGFLNPTAFFLNSSGSFCLSNCVYHSGVLWVLGEGGYLQILDFFWLLVYIVANFMYFHMLLTELKNTGPFSGIFRNLGSGRGQIAGKYWCCQPSWTNYTRNRPFLTPIVHLLTGNGLQK